jgi:hypothetical protein
MTISSQTFRFPYVSVGGTVYPYTNKILDENDLKVYVSDVLKTIGTDYTVSGVGQPTGGNVTFGVAPAAGAAVLLVKDGVEFTQETDYVENDSFPAAEHENALDKLTNIAQKIWDYTRRSIKVAITSTLTDLEITPQANAYIGWNPGGTALENKTLVSLGAISDTTYDSTTWDGDTAVAPSKNAVRDKIESLVVDIAAKVADTAYDSTVWDGVTTISPSKNAVRDKVESLVVDISAKISDTAYNSTAWDGVTTIAPSKNAVRDELEVLRATKISGDVVQVVHYQTGAYATSAATIPLDDTIPQITEGMMIMALPVTPTNASNLLYFDVIGNLSCSGTDNITMSLCQNAVASALAAVLQTLVNDYASPINLRHKMTAGTAVSTTFQVRAGCAGNNTYFNGSAGRKLGGVMASSITITEIKA